MQKGVKIMALAMLPIQPFSTTLGLGYQADNDKWNVLFSGRYVSAKKAKDAIDIPNVNSLQLDVDKKTGVVSDFRQPKPYRF